MDLAALLSYAKAKQAGGIITADRYLAPVAQCFADDKSLCPDKLFGKAQGDQWAKALKDAESRLTFSGDTSFADASKSYTGDEDSVFLLTRDCVVSTGRKDRDNDILDPSGAIFRTKVFCWQHNPMLPIGAVWNGSHSDKSVKCTFGVVDVFDGLGRDAALLIKADALQISHGFNPLVFEPIKGGGWHVKSYEIMEVSGVSVPSNVEAVIELFAAGKFAHPLVKSWAKGYHDLRPAQGKGFGEGKSCQCGGHTEPAADAADPKGANPPTEKRVNGDAGPKGAKSAPLYGPLPDSYEDICQHLAQQLDAWLVTCGVMESRTWRCYSHLMGVYDGYCIASVVTIDRDDNWTAKPYRLGWSSTNGKVELSGTPEAVDLAVSLEITAKSIKGLHAKSLAALDAKSFGGQTGDFPSPDAKSIADMLQRIELAVSPPLKTWDEAQKVVKQAAIVATADELTKLGDDLIDAALAMKRRDTRQQEHELLSTLGITG